MFVFSSSFGKELFKSFERTRNPFHMSKFSSTRFNYFFPHWSCHWQYHCQKKSIRNLKKKIPISLPSIFLHDYFCLAFTSLVNADFKEGISLDNKGNDWTSSDRGMELLKNGSKESEQVLCLTGAKILTFCQKRKRNCNMHWCLQNSMFQRPLLLQPHYVVSIVRIANADIHK